jgi:hypothetical protein
MRGDVSSSFIAACSSDVIWRPNWSIWIAIPAVDTAHISVRCGSFVSAAMGESFQISESTQSTLNRSASFRARNGLTGSEALNIAETFTHLITETDEIDLGKEYIAPSRHPRFLKASATHSNQDMDKSKATAQLNIRDEPLTCPVTLMRHGRGGDGLESGSTARKDRLQKPPRGEDS